MDLQNFSATGLTSLDLALVDSGLKGFQGGFTDGRYGYFVPFSNAGGNSGKVARVDLQNFASAGVSWIDLTSVDSSLKGFKGGFTDGRHGYLVPNNSATSGKVARLDLRNFSAGGVSVVDLALTDSELKNFFGGFTDGRHGYFLNTQTLSNGKIARIQLFAGNGNP